MPYLDIIRLLKDSKLKVQASIQGDAVRVTGAKRDDLQSAMAMLKKEIKDLPLGINLGLKFNNSVELLKNL